MGVLDGDGVTEIVVVGVIVNVGVFVGVEVDVGVIVIVLVEVGVDVLDAVGLGPTDAVAVKVFGFLVWVEEIASKVWVA